MKHAQTSVRIMSVMVAAATAVSLAGCGSSNHPGKKASPTAAMATGQKTGKKGPTFTGMQGPMPSGAALTNVPDMYNYVHQTGCSSVAGGWMATGTARNVTTKPLAFKILVFFTDAQARFVDSSSATVTVPANTTDQWTAERRFKAPVGTRCQVRAVNKA